MDTVWSDVPTGDFLTDVHAELARARKKFPLSNCSLAALTEEVGELAQACLKVRAGVWDKKRIYDEAVQVAAMACRVAVEGDASLAAVPYAEPDPD